MQEPLSAYRNLKVERKDTNHKTSTNNTMEKIQHHKYEHSNKWVFNRALKWLTEFAWRIWTGRLFHKLDAAKEKDLCNACNATWFHISFMYVIIHSMMAAFTFWCHTKPLYLDYHKITWTSQ